MLTGKLYHVPYGSSRPELFCKKDVLENFIKFTGKQACNFIEKETLTQVFSCEFCEIFKNTFFHRTPPVAASYSRLHFYCHYEKFLERSMLKLHCFVNEKIIFTNSEVYEFTFTKIKYQVIFEKPIT